MRMAECWLVFTSPAYVVAGPSDRMVSLSFELPALPVPVPEEVFSRSHTLCCPKEEQHCGTCTGHYEHDHGKPQRRLVAQLAGPDFRVPYGIVRQPYDDPQPDEREDGGGALQQ